MEAAQRASNITAPTQFLAVKNEKYAYRRFGSGPALPLLLVQHFTGTLDNWDSAVSNPLAQRAAKRIDSMSRRRRSAASK